MPESITTRSGRPVYLPGNNIDTDRIIPARYLKCVTFDGLGDHAFEDDRIAAKGTHPFDLPPNKGHSILVVDENFGSGSSREHAVPAIMQRGFNVIVGISFADIFQGNAVGNGLVCVTVAKDDHARIVDKINRGVVTWMVVDIKDRIIEVRVDDRDDSAPPTVPCSIPESNRSNFIEGRWDAMAVCLEAGGDIERLEAGLPYSFGMV